MPTINPDIRIKNNTSMDNLATTIVRDESPDLNDYVSTGSFWFNLYHSPVNAPESANAQGWLQVLRADSTVVKQIWYSYYTGHHYNIYERTKSGTWTNWKRLMYDEDNTRSAIMCYLSAPSTIQIDTAWGQYKIPVNKTKFNIGDKFTLESDGNITYTGSRPIKMTVHVYFYVDGSTSEQDGYPCSNIDTYYQEFCNASRPTATYIAYGEGSGTYYGIIRPSKAGAIALQGNSASPYTFVTIEEL